MNDKDRELIERIMSALGEAGKHGFEQLIRFQVVDGVLSAICFAIGFAGMLWAFRRLLAWTPEKDYDDDIKHIVRGIALVLCGLVAFAMLSGIESNIVQALQPEGSILHAALTHK